MISRETPRTLYVSGGSDHTLMLKLCSNDGQCVVLSSETNGIQVFAEPSSESSTCVEGPKSWIPSAEAWKIYFMQEVAGDKYLEMQLLLMTVVTGALDAMTYTTYRVFTTKQTGNALFLALFAFRNPAISPMTEQNVAVSMSVFFAGALFWGQLGRISRQRRRIWLIASQAFQALSILAATAIRYWASRKSTGPGALGILTLLSFAMSGQIATALNVNMPELNTTMITGALIALASDKDLFRWKNNKRARRILFFASIEAGSFIGAALLNFRSPTSTILVCAAVKFLIVGTFLFNRGIVKQPKNISGGHGPNIDGTVTPVSRILWGD